jgi:hypothetical protein
MMITEKHMYSNFVLIHQLLRSECLEQGLIDIFILLRKYSLVFSRLLVVLVNKILIFSFPNQCQLLHTIETRENPKGKYIKRKEKIIHHTLFIQVFVNYRIMMVLFSSSLSILKQKVVSFNYW